MVTKIDVNGTQPHPLYLARDIEAALRARARAVQAIISCAKLSG
jgi:hypothetical protein